MGRLSGKVAIVTGGASGLGEATVRRFVAEGCRVVISDIDDQRGQALAKDLGDATLYFHCDHTNRQETQGCVQAALEKWGQLDILHNNAGAPFSGAFEDVDDATLERVFNINMVGPFRMTQAALPALRESAEKSPAGASILFTASLQAIMARPNFTPYTTAKHGIIGLVRGLALELAGANIRVNAICPAATDTPMLKDFLPGMAADWDTAKEKFRQTVPLGRMAEPEDTANAALFLASDEASMITGIALPVDGGTTAG